MRSKGKIASWNDEKGFGFIAPLAGGRQAFVHITAFRNRNRRPQLGEVISYATSTDEQGRPCAVEATLAGDRLAPEGKPKQGLVSTIAAAAFLLFVGALVHAAKLPLPVLAVYLVASIVSFIAYAADKSAARTGAWRIRERTLHLLALAGGWPGALIAQQRLRHKSKKESFRAVFWVTVWMNCGALVWLLTPFGAAALRAFTVR